MSLKRYRKLSDIEHVTMRKGMYVGSTTPHTTSTWLLSEDKQQFEEREVTFSPALIKLFDEVISNSVDEHIRSGKVNRITVDISRLTGSITVEDNGGIPVQKHPEYDQYIPEMIFGELRTGSNFNDDDRETIGLHGLGCKLVNILSDEFIVETHDGKKKFIQTFRNGMLDRDPPSITSSNRSLTKITFTPTYSELDSPDGITTDVYDKLVKRVYDLAGCNPKIRFTIDGQNVQFKTFSDYVALYTNEAVGETQDSWDVCVAPSTNDTFSHVSFVNGVDTFNGGTHIDYVVNQITTAIREHIRKKHKIDVRPNIIKQQMMVFIKCTVNAPTFTSQTKEFMSLEVSNYGTSYKPSDKFIRQILNSSIVTKVLDYVEGEKRRAELAELRKLNRTTQNSNFLKRIVKFDDATSKNRSECMLILTEGDSAAASILSARDAKTMGVFPLRGKPINVRDIDVKRLVNNEEFSNIMAIIGLKIGQKVKSLDELRFSKLCVASDADGDGVHIYLLIVNMMNEFWPELIELGFIHRLTTPLVIANNTEFFSLSEYNEYKESNTIKSHKYYKGLGSFTAKEFKKFLSDEKYLKQLVKESDKCIEMLDIAFDKSKADERKEWLVTE